MDTNSLDPVSPARGRSRYRHHSQEFKRVVVEETFRPGALSVARIARHHGINANQVFKWRSSTAQSHSRLRLHIMHVLRATVHCSSSVRVAGCISKGNRMSTLRVVLEQLLR
ncbi:MAG: transposase [Gammaproteobacteria bacterium]|nr:transposase [Gammaproteobacteria bacterium]